jgi:acetyl-CoA carboxylase biotin carboxylase subunit
MFRKILVANRGEIAVRVVRACREMGIAAVAVYSEADRDALHVRLADEAYPIGPPAPQESYLSIPRILEAARLSKAEAIHPGYGFLSENPLFPEACAKAKVVFIGPGAKAMRLMGNKVTARAAMVEAGVPVTPGTEILPEDPEEARRRVEEVMTAGTAEVPAGRKKAAGPASAYPVLLKAAAGGGGKGMRAVVAAAEFASAYTQARSEGQSAFGDPSIYAERLVRRPRHIEIQVLADAQGHTVHLGERECTIQRRHQKLIEEAPSPVVDAATRARLGELGVRAARAAGYVGAGTCEFLRDAGGAFYFMEMNARLQVEHPVTEMVTGLDLVKLQIRIAAGESLPFTQDDVAMRGWAIECRIFAEDPSRNFMPSPGRIGTLRVPSGPGIRDDGGVYQGYRVPVYYDPMISKLVAWGEDRAEAIARMRRALDEYRIEGVRTTIPFHRRVFRHPAFIAGDMDTSFIQTHKDALIAPPPVPAAEAPNGRPLSTREIAVIVAAVAAFRKAEAASAGAGAAVASGAGTGAGAGAGSGAPSAGTARRGAWSTGPGGWKLSSRLSALRDR